MNLWETWYLDYQASESIDQDLIEKFALWSARLGRFFVLAGYAPGQSSFDILPHEALSLIGFMYRDNVDIEILLDMAEDYTNDGEFQIPIQWLENPEDMARLHVAWAHTIVHDPNSDGFWLTSRDDLSTLSDEERLCWLLDTAEFILELGAILDEQDRVRLETWAKLLFSDKMIGITAPLLTPVEEKQPTVQAPIVSQTLSIALATLCRADYLDSEYNLVTGPSIREAKAKDLTETLALSLVSEAELVTTLHQLFKSSTEKKISSTVLSDTHLWLEEALDLAQAQINTSPLGQDAVNHISDHLIRAQYLARINAILSSDEQALIRNWAYDLCHA